MESTDDFWNFFDRMPVLLQQYSTHSYALLSLLGMAGIILLVSHFRKKQTSGEGLSMLWVTAGSALLFLSVSGAVLKYSHRVTEQRQGEEDIARYLETYRVADNEHWVIVIDFAGHMKNRSAEDLDSHLAKMQSLVAGIKEILLEDIPESFSEPKVKLVPTDQSPWQNGVDDNNFDEVIEKLNGDELMWGVIHEDNLRGKAFLALSSQLSELAGQGMGRQAPLHDLDLNSDLRRDFQFNRDGYSRLMGMVMLGMALETVERARLAQGMERRNEFLRASKQLTAMRKKVASAREDMILKRTVYSSLIDELIAECEREAEGQS